MFRGIDVPPTEDGSRGFDPNGLYVMLPARCLWNMNETTSKGARWTVTGKPPNVSATPSINFVGKYHGYVTNGVVTDDVEGRKF
jgi:hypothetical protein